MANTINFVLNQGAVIVHGSGTYAKYQLSINCGTCECAKFGTSGIIIYPNSNPVIQRVLINDWHDMTGNISIASYQSAIASLGALLSLHPISISGGQLGYAYITGTGTNTYNIPAAIGKTVISVSINGNGIQPDEWVWNTVSGDLKLGTDSADWIYVTYQ